MNNEQKNLINTDAVPKEYAVLWHIAENWSKKGIIEWDKQKFKDHLFLHPFQIDGESIRGNNLYEYFKEKKIEPMNANVWSYLKEHSDQIPDEWKTDKNGNEQYIFFWGTIDRSPDGNLYVRYLSWSGGNWVFSNFLMSGNWHNDFPTAIFN